MDALLISARIVLPFFVMGLIGFVVARVLKLEHSVFEGANRLITNIFLPALIFVNVYKCDFSSFRGEAVLFATAIVIIDYLLFLLIVPKIEREPETAGVIIHALFRGNTTAYGIPVAIGILGDGDLSTMLVVLGVVIILYNVLGPLTVSIFGKTRGSLKSVLKSLATAPMLLAGILAFMLSEFQVPLPSVIDSTINALAAVTTPLAFVALGATFTLKISREHRRIIGVFTPLRLLVIPCVWLAVAALLLGFRDGALVAILVVLATPPAIATYSLSQSYGLNHTLAGELVVTSTAASIVTLMLFILAFKLLEFA